MNATHEKLMCFIRLHNEEFNESIFSLLMNAALIYIIKLFIAFGLS